MAHYFYFNLLFLIKEWIICWFGINQRKGKIRFKIESRNEKKKEIR